MARITRKMFHQHSCFLLFDQPTSSLPNLNVSRSLQEVYLLGFVIELVIQLLEGLEHAAKPTLLALLDLVWGLSEQILYDFL